MATFAIVKVNGKQYLAQEGEVMVVDRMDAEAGKTVQIKDILLTSDGKTTKVGTPHVAGAVVEVTVAAHPRGAKGLAFRYRPKKRERRARGFRADLTELKVTKVKA
ncbi:MAG: 50S ribosomal protein L21 [Candidatus Andersenbacteria bacterium]